MLLAKQLDTTDDKHAATRRMLELSSTSKGTPNWYLNITEIYELIG